jgi:hypothetical protein
MNKTYIEKESFLESKLSKKIIVPTEIRLDFN